MPGFSDICEIVIQKRECVGSTTVVYNRTLWHFFSIKQQQCRSLTCWRLRRIRAEEDRFLTLVLLFPIVTQPLGCLCTCVYVTCTKIPDLHVFLFTVRVQNSEVKLQSDCASTDGRMDGWVGVRMARWMDRWMAGCMHRWMMMNGWVGGWIGWMDG